MHWLLVRVHNAFNWVDIRHSLHRYVGRWSVCLCNVASWQVVSTVGRLRAGLNVLIRVVCLPSQVELACWPGCAVQPAGWRQVNRPVASPGPAILPYHVSSFAAASPPLRLPTAVCEGQGYGVVNGVCQLCPTGYYSSGPGTCSTCATGSTSVGNGATTCAGGCPDVQECRQTGTCMSWHPRPAVCCVAYWQESDRRQGDRLPLPGKFLSLCP